MDRIANRRHKNGERDAEDTEDMDVEQLNPREMMLEDGIEREENVDNLYTNLDIGGGLMSLDQQRYLKHRGNRV